MREARPSAIHLQDYQPPAYLVERTELEFQLYEDHAQVTSRLAVRRQDHTAPGTPLQLHGDGLELLGLAIDGRTLAPGEYRTTDEGLEVDDVPAAFRFECLTRIRPQDNTALDGLYKSHSMFCTQCEAHGFRKITYYPDRPDVMAVFTVTIEAQRERYPVLLSNGNLVTEERLANGRHLAVWHDPYPKPAYLFALVAGDLHFVADSFRTRGGRDVQLRVYVEEKDLDKCAHAMSSLQRAMRWDEQVYGREYDLDLFNIVAVDDFNMGAMENKGLNIFNSSCVLCSAATSTDATFQRVESIVAHEYFHNWSGNRVTCRDWFQLSLKEGFTVFRDATFSADMGSPTVKRVEDVMLLRATQFAEDAGPMAHPVRPESVIEINNFYTATVYEKGSEVVRMIHTLLGPAAFRRGADLYFERHDGQAVTCEDFVQAMEDASGVDLGQFRLWYSQAGTPVLRVRDDYDPQTARYTLEVAQSCPATPGQVDKLPMVIPLAMGLLGEAGNLPLRLAGDVPDPESRDNTHRVLVVDQPRQQFVFESVMERPVPSLLRGFSAPVRLEYDFSAAELRALMARDDDGFVRWDSAQALAIRVLGEVQSQLRAGQEPRVNSLLLDACNDLLEDASLDPAMVAAMLALPPEDYLADLAGASGGADVDTLHAARVAVKAAVAEACEKRLLQRYRALHTTAEYAPDGQQIAARSLRNTCLDYLCCAAGPHLDLAQAQFREASNMTDRLAALRCIAFYGPEVDRATALQSFYADWGHDSLVVNQWLGVQAAIPAGDGLARVQALTRHPGFELRNPNKVRSLVGVFTRQNPLHFHRQDGEGYRFLADMVGRLDPLNPQIAAKLLTPLTRWHIYPARAQAMQAQLQRLAALESLSPDVYEVVSKSLQAAG
ncbi:MAG: aminopeptidase N [Halieaceae bacterium]|nr:aminopeptidase N [Halieaceae bacterium]MCP5163908.1 aminopeptidase N [Pseudomonadales bacterium]MCP5202958.1 aminopeptidase N [Pseudomonadales bacterium]